MPKHREGRLNEEVKRILADVLRSLKDPRIPELTSVTKVSVTPDLKYAKVGISVLGNEDAQKGALKALSEARGFIRRELSKKLAARTAPEIIFELDDSIAYGARITKILKEISDGNESDSE